MDLANAECKQTLAHLLFSPIHFHRRPPVESIASTLEDLVSSMCLMTFVGPGIV